MKNKLLYNFFRIALVISASNVYAATSLIDVGHIQGVPSGAVGSGNGTLDILLFTQGVNDNAISGSNFDDGNTDLSSGINNGDADFWDESYVTSGKKLKDFYRLNFGPATTSAELMFSLDLNETGGGLPENYFSTIDIIVNPDANSLGFDVNEGYPDPLATDVQAAQQNAIDQVFSGGNLLATMTLDARLQVLNGTSQGGGFADFFVLSGVDAFTFEDDDIVVINISMTHLSNGNEGVFLSGNFSSSDVCDTSNGGVSCQAPIVVPVPAAIWMFGSGLVMLMGRRYRKG